MSEERASYSAEEALPEERGPSSLEEIESLYDAPEEPDYELTLDRGAKVRVRRITDVSEVLRIKKKAEAVVKVARGKTPLAAWKPFLPAEPEVIEQAYILSQMLTEPEITLVKALEWAKTRAPLFAEIGNKITQRLFQESAQAEAEGIELAGEE